MLRILTTSLLACGALILGACGKDDDKNADRDAKRAAGNLIEESGIVGYWASPCDSYAPLQMAGRAHFAFEPSVYTKQVRVYSDPQCNTASAEIRFHGEFTIGSGDDLQGGLRRLDLKVTKVEVKPLSDQGVQALNTMKLCTLDNWAKDKTVDVTALVAQTGCLPEKADTTEYDVMKIQDGKLYFGETYLQGASTDQAKRATKAANHYFEPSEKWE